MGRLFRKVLIPVVFLSSLFAESNSSVSFKKGPPIIFYYSDREEVNRKEKDFETVYNYLKTNWDRFPEQFSLARSIVFSNELESRAEATCPEEIIFRDFNKLTFIHELAHIQYCNLDIENLKKRWNDIAGNHYLGDKYHQASIENLAAIGGISYYSLKDFREDIAETAVFIYLLNDPMYHVHGFSDDSDFMDKKHERMYIDAQMIFLDREKIRPFTSKLVQKIGLLQEYGFVSEREASNAINKISGRLKH